MYIKNITYIQNYIYIYFKKIKRNKKNSWLTIQPAETP